MCIGTRNATHGSAHEYGQAGSPRRSAQTAITAGRQCRQPRTLTLQVMTAADCYASDLAGLGNGRWPLSTGVCLGPTRVFHGREGSPEARRWTRLQADRGLTRGRGGIASVRRRRWLPKITQSAPSGSTLPKRRSQSTRRGSFPRSGCRGVCVHVWLGDVHRGQDIDPPRRAFSPQGSKRRCDRCGIGGPGHDERRSYGHDPG